MDQERVFHVYAQILASLVNRSAHRSPSHMRKEIIQDAMQYAIEGVEYWEKIVGEKALGDDDGEV